MTRRTGPAADPDTPAVTGRDRVRSSETAVEWMKRTRWTMAPVYLAGGTAGAAWITYAADAPQVGVGAAVAVAGVSRFTLSRIRADLVRARRAAVAVGGSYTGLLLSAAAGLNPMDFTASAAGVPSWVFAATAAGSIVEWNSSRLAQDAKVAQTMVQDWPAAARAMGAPALTLVGRKVELVPHGVTYHVSAPRGREAVKMIDVGRAAATWSVSREWISVVENPKNPRRATLTVYFSDPWADVDNRHPALIGEGEWAGVNRTVMDPAPIGLPAGAVKGGDGSALLPLCTPGGGVQVNVGGRKGSGKSVGMNSITASVLACYDALVFHVDIPKRGVEAEDWGAGCIDWLATTFEEADRMFTALLALIEHRNTYRWKPTRTDPLIVLIIDELKSLLNPSDPRTNARWSDVLTGKLEDIGRLCRSAGISLVLGTQRPTEDAFGGSVTLREQADLGVCFALRKADDVPYVLGVETNVNVGLWTEKGLFIGSGPHMHPDKVWRGFDLSNPADVRTIAARYGTGRPVLPAPAVAVMGAAYATRERPGTATVDTPLEAPPMDAQDVAEEFDRMTEDLTGGGFTVRDEYLGKSRAELAAHAARTREAAQAPAPTLVVDVPPVGDPAHMDPQERADYERMKSPAGQAWREQAASAWRPPAMRPEHADVVALLRRAGTDGARTTDLMRELGWTRATTLRRLSELRDMQHAQMVGATHNLRWVLTWNPEDEEGDNR